MTSEYGNLTTVGVRPLRHDDAAALRRFVLMAAFPSGRDLPPDPLEMPHARRWLCAWDDELEMGVGWEEGGELLGAAWARRVEPVLVRDVTGEPLPEIIIGVVDRARGAGIGKQLMQTLQSRAQSARCPGLSLSVSERNHVAVRLYEEVGFVQRGRTPTGLLTMVWARRA